jgi:hypothetical protein
MDDKDIAYFAGFFDGEGSCGLYYQNGRKYPPRLEARITNTYVPVLEELKTCFGGNVYCRKKTPLRHKPVYAWAIVNKEGVRKFLNTIYPYLREKKDKVGFYLGL